MKNSGSLVFNLGVLLCVLVGVGTTVNALPDTLRAVGSVGGLLMVGLGYAMKRNEQKV